MHKHPVLHAAFLMTALLAAPLAYAQEEAGEEAAAEDTGPALPSQAKNKPAEQPQGLASDVVGYKFPRGIYTSADLGFFWRYLGFSDNLTGAACVRCKYPTYLVSNAQPWISIAVGYDLPIPEKFRVGVAGQMTLGTGFVDGAAPYSRARSASLGRTFRQEESPKDHGILMAHPTLAVNFIPPPFERLLLEGKLFTGVALFNPSAQRYDDFLTKPQWYLSTFGLNAGFSLGFKYMTLLTNFVVGMDLSFYSMFSPGWGSELYVPAAGEGWPGRVCGEQPVPENGIGFSPGSGAACRRPDQGYKIKSVAVIPLVFATSITPIVIKYVF